MYVYLDSHNESTLNLTVPPKPTAKLSDPTPVVDLSTTLVEEEEEESSSENIDDLIEKDKKLSPAKTGSFRGVNIDDDLEEDSDPADTDVPPLRLRPVSQRLRSPISPGLSNESINLTLSTTIQSG